MLSAVVVQATLCRGVQASHWGTFFLSGAQALGAWAQ